MGATLLHRRGRGIELTSTGERFLAFARRTLDEYNAFRGATTSSSTTLSGQLRIVASTTPGEFLVPDLVARFTALHPAVDPHEHVTDSASAVRELLAGGWDLGFSGRHIPHPRLTYEPIGQDEIVLAVPAGHTLAHRSAVHIDALVGERLILREEGSGTLQTFRETLAARGLRLPDRHGAVRLGTTQAVLSAVEAGLGIGLVSIRALEHHKAASGQRVRVVGVPIVRSLYLLLDTSRPHPPHVHAFVDFSIEQGRGRPPDRRPGSPTSRGARSAR